MDRKRFKWTRQMIGILIVSLEKHENLYNTQHEHYLNRGKRADAYKTIRDDIKRANSGTTNLTVELLKKKIHTLRTQYSQELRSLQKYKTKYNGKMAAPKLWCFEQLNFLRKFCIQKTSTGNAIPAIEIRHKPYFVDDFDGEEIYNEDVLVDGNGNGDEQNVNTDVCNTSYIYTSTNGESKNDINISEDEEITEIDELQKTTGKNRKRSHKTIEITQLDEAKLLNKVETVETVEEVEEDEGGEEEEETDDDEEENKEEAEENNMNDETVAATTENLTFATTTTTAKKSKRQQRIETQNLLIIKKVKKLQEKLHYKLHNMSKDYNWLGDQVISEINNLKSDKIRKKAIWAIQDVLRNATMEDDAETEEVMDISLI